MAKPRLLLVDGDPRFLRVMEVSLRKAGFHVSAATTARQALELCAREVPDLILSDTRLPEEPGFELARRVKADPRLREVAFVFLSSLKAVEDRVRALELGVEEVLAKPVYIREVVARVRFLLQRRQREAAAFGEPRGRFAGELADLGVVDLVQLLELGRKTCVLRLLGRDGRTGALWWREGRIVDAELGAGTGEAAFYRLLAWQEGAFSVDFGPVEREERIALGTGALLLEGVRRLDEWSRAAERLPPLDGVYEPDPWRLAALPPGEAPPAELLRLLDGRRTLEQVIEEAAGDDLAAAERLARLYADELIRPARGEYAMTPQPGPLSPAPKPR